jgi:hypothetical protein
MQSSNAATNQPRIGTASNRSASMGVRAKSMSVTSAASMPASSGHVSHARIYALVA